MKKLSILLLLNIISYFSLLSQGTPIRYFENLKWINSTNEVKGNLLYRFHSSIIPTNQKDYFEEVDTSRKNEWTSIAKLNFEYYKYSTDSLTDYLKIASKTKTFFRYFNTNPSHLYSSFGNYYYFTIDPLIDIRLGHEISNSSKIFTNTRGIRLLAGIDHKVYIFSEITENQIKPLDYISDFAKLNMAFPGAGFIKSYSSKIFKIHNGYDYILAEGGLNFNITKHINLSFGHGKNFIGQGIRSLLISDFSPPQFYLKINSQFGRFRYVNIFSELAAGNRFTEGGDKLITKKYAASHYLSFNVSNKWNIGLFESIIFNRNRGFELQYLNPVIFYRAIEQAVGSPDNVLLALQSHFNFFKSFTLYSQLLIDEFVFKRLISSNQGWWGNKHGFQLGIKYPEVAGLPNLNAQLEYNSVRPYTYSYSDSLGSYSHYNQSIAHPLGSNFNEIISTISYQLGKKVYLELTMMNYSKGLDIDTLNYGGNILLPNITRVSDFNNTITQGQKIRVNQLQWKVSYEFLQRTWLEFNFGIRNSNNSIHNSNLRWFEIGLRMNLSSRNYFF